MHNILVFQLLLQSIDLSNWRERNSCWLRLNFCFMYRSDTQAEIDLVRRIAIENGAFDAVMADHWAQGRWI